MVIHVEYAGYEATQIGKFLEKIFDSERLYCLSVCYSGIKVAVYASHVQCMLIGT